LFYNENKDPVLIINLRGSHVEMADLHATTILYMDSTEILCIRGGPLDEVVFIEPNNFLNLMLLDIFLSFKALQHFFLFCGHIYRSR
jgi:hypothetical protein